VAERLPPSCVARHLCEAIRLLHTDRRGDRGEPESFIEPDPVPDGQKRITNSVPVALARLSASSTMRRASPRPRWSALTITPPRPTTAKRPSGHLDLRSFVRPRGNQTALIAQGNVALLRSVLERHPAPSNGSNSSPSNSARSSSVRGPKSDDLHTRHPIKRGPCVATVRGRGRTWADGSGALRHLEGIAGRQRSRLPTAAATTLSLPRDLSGVGLASCDSYPGRSRVVTVVSSAAPPDLSEAGDLRWLRDPRHRRRDRKGR